METSTRTHRIACLMLVALSFVIGLQILRVFFVLVIGNFANRIGLTSTALLTAGVMLSPLLILLLCRMFNPRRTLMIAVIGLVLVRLVMQVALSPQVIGPLLAIVGVGLTLIVWTMLLAWLRSLENGGYIFLVGMICGFAVDTALMSAFLSWDYIWQPGLVPLLLTVIFSAGILFLMWMVENLLGDTPGEIGWGAALILPFVMLQVLFFQNLGFIISASGLRLPLAAGFILLTNGLAVLAISRIYGKALTPAHLLAGIVGMIGLMLAALYTNGIVVIPVLLTGQILGAMLLGMSLSTPTDESETLFRSALTMIIGGGLLAAIGFGYFQIQRVELPLTNATAGITGVVVLVGASFLLRSGSIPDFRSIAIPAALLIVPAALLVIQPASQPDVFTKDKFRVVTYNVHYGVNASGALNLEDIALVLEAQDADVIFLQEVSRGVLTGGSTDIATWLSLRLKMDYVYAPARDWQIGNVTLSHLPLLDWRSGEVARIANQTRRTYLRSAYDVGGERITIINTHLSVGIGLERRMAQVQDVISAWNEAPRTVIGGDMNAFPGKVDMQMLFNAGFLSAQDEAGDPAVMTYSSTESLFRIDWIFGTPDLKFLDFAIPPTTASDHLPLVTTVEIEHE